jgi:hypothetical protein
MRVASTKAFNQFLLDNGQAYPYSRLQVTRSSFFYKWIMTKGHGTTGVTEYFPVLANSTPNAVLLYMIESGKAKPLPPVLSQIMDHMHWWGLQCSLEWYQQVIPMLDQALNTEEINRRELVSLLVYPLVLEDIRNQFAADSVAEHLLKLEWMKWYKSTYKSGDRTPFRRVAEKSSQFIKNAIWLLKNPVVVID